MTKKSRSESSVSQKDVFIRTARELGCDEDLEAFERAVRTLAKAPPSPKPRRTRDKPTRAGSSKES